MEKSLIEVYNKSFEKVKEIIKKGILREGIEYKRNKIFLHYFKNRLEIDLINEKFYPEIEDKEKILVLHYICGNYKTDSDEIITFKNLPEGSFYFPSIYSRVYLPLIEKYGKNPEKFIEKFEKIGGERISFFSVKINIFPEIFFIFEIIPEDEEFSPDLKVFFNRRGSEIFEIEDLAIIGEIIVSKII